MTDKTKPGDECMSDADAKSIAFDISQAAMQAIERRFGKYPDYDFDTEADELQGRIASDALAWVRLPQTWIDRKAA